MLSEMLDYAAKKYPELQQYHINELKEGAKLISNIERGNEKQLYNIGDIVDGNGLGFYTGKIVDIYTINGYIWYTIEYKLPKSRKTYYNNIRQKDIALI